MYIISYCYGFMLFGPFFARNHFLKKVPLIRKRNAINLWWSNTKKLVWNISIMHDTRYHWSTFNETATKARCLLATPVSYYGMRLSMTNWACFFMCVCVLGLTGGIYLRKCSCSFPVGGGGGEARGGGGRVKRRATNIPFQCLYFLVYHLGSEI